MSDDIRVEKLSSGWYHVYGRGPCEWSQPPVWPCSEQTLREHAFAHASERFIRAASKLAARLGVGDADGL